jgi:hypothetical protein
VPTIPQEPIVQHDFVTEEMSHGMESSAIQNFGSKVATHVSLPRIDHLQDSV